MINKTTTQIFQIIGLLSLVLFCLPSYAVNINFGPNGCTLQDAIRSANADAARGNCSAGSGHDFLIAPDGWSITLSSRLPTITSDLTIKPTTTSGLLTISGDNDHPVMKITGSSTDVTLSRVMITQGNSSTEKGAGIQIIDANVTLLNSIVSFNTSYTQYGGGVYIDNGTLTIEDSYLEFNAVNHSANNVRSKGGAIYAKDSDVTVIGSRFTQNDARFGFYKAAGEFDYWLTGYGASIYVESSDLLVSQSLFWEKNSAVHGEGSVAEIENSTFAVLPEGSQYDQLSRVYFTDFSALTLNHVTMKSDFRIRDSILVMTNTILEGNCHISDNTSWIIDAGNLYFAAPNFTRCRGTANAFFDPELQLLNNNGGSTETFGLQTGSPAIDGGNLSYCLPTDQRGVARDATCDVGAFESTEFVDIEVEGELDEDPFYVHGQELIYLAKIKNNSSAVANEVRIYLNTQNVTITDIDYSLCPSFPCTLTNLQGLQEITIPVHVLMSQSQDNFTFNLTAEKISNPSVPDTDLSNNDHQLTGAIDDGADMSIQMDLLTQTDHYLGEPLEYAVAVTNLGFNTAPNTSFEFRPDGLEILSFTGCSSVSAQTCQLGSVNNGATKNITVLTKITASEFDAVAEVSSSLIDINPANNIDLQGNNGALGLTDVQVGISDVIGSPFYSYGYVEISVKVSTGNESASNIRVWGSYPGAEFISCSHFFNLDGYCEVPSIPANSNVFVTFRYFNPVTTSSSPQQHTFSVLATPGETDTNPNNNADSTNISIIPTSDMAAQLSLVTPPPYYSNQELEFRLRVVNGGVNTASQIDIDIVPDNLTLQWMDGNLCNTESCNIAAMELSNEENIVLVYRIQNAGAFSLSASAYANQVDQVPANNNDVVNGTATQTARSNTIFVDDFEE